MIMKTQIKIIMVFLTSIFFSFFTFLGAWCISVKSRVVFHENYQFTVISLEDTFTLSLPIVATTRALYVPFFPE